MRRAAVLLLAGLAGCEARGLPALRALPSLEGPATAAAPRVNGRVGSPDALPNPQVSVGQVRAVTLSPGGAGPGGGAAGGDVSLDFVDTDLREVVAQVLGTILRVTYTIDPAVRGTATLRTATPVARSQLLPALQALLAQNGASLVQSGDIYRVVPAAAGSPVLAGSDATSGGGIVPLRYASAEDLAKVLQPYVGAGGKVVADPGRNVLLISGDAPTRDALVSLIRAFDIDILAGQSYALFPVTSGGAKDFATALSDAFRSGSGGGGLGGGGGSGLGGRGGGGLGSGSGLGGGLGAQGGAGQGDPSQNPANPLLGGLDPSASPGSSPGGANEGEDANSVRIIPNGQNNAILLYATASERDTIEAMLRKIDILPLQVRIDATVAEVTLNDTLQYGTQFFFNAGINGALNFSPAGAAAGAFASGFPGFVLSGPRNGNAALNALQAVTDVKVLSSPQVLVLDNEAARLQVGNLVPYLTASSQSQITNNAPIVNSIDYRETGVILEVTPRVNSGGLVTLDISQEVSDVVAAQTTAGINSPTFSQRNVSSRVVVQDGQTVGLAGLIRDTANSSSSGIPFLKDVPLLGLLAGSQNNARIRTELLVLITPHVVHDQRDARALTEDLRDQLINAAQVPDTLQQSRASGSADPQRPLRRNLQLER